MRSWAEQTLDLREPEAEDPGRGTNSAGRPMTPSRVLDVNANSEGPEERLGLRLLEGELELDVDVVDVLVDRDRDRDRRDLRGGLGGGGPCRLERAGPRCLPGFIQDIIEGGGSLVSLDFLYWRGRGRSSITSLAR